MAALAHSAQTLTLTRKRARSLFILTIVFMAVAMFLAALSESQAQAAQAAADGTVSEFEISDVFQPWSWIILAGTFAIAFMHGMTRAMPFASIIQFSLIILMLVCFVLIAQQYDRDFYRVGVTGLIFFTLLQIGYGNIPQDANLRKALLGTAVTIVILAFIVWLSISLVPWLIDLG